MNNSLADRTDLYGADQIVVLEGLEGARKNPGMYIGNTDDGSGLHKMLDEIFDNAIDEAQINSTQRCNFIEIFIRKDSSIFITDNGRGIPVEVHPKSGKPTVEVVMTSLHAGGKFKGDKAGGAYEKTGGLHGVGASVVNALSDFMEVLVWRDGKEYLIRFEKGKTATPLRVNSNNPSRKCGTGVHFMPSEEIFCNIEWNRDIIIARIKEAAFLNPAVTFVFTDERDGQDNEAIIYNYPNGIVDFVEDVIKMRNLIIDPNDKLDDEKRLGILHPIIHIEGTRLDVGIDTAFVWCNTMQDIENITCFTNNIKQINGGAHLIGLRAGVSKAVLHYIEQYGNKREKTVVINEDVREGLLGIVCVKVNSPKFSSQTKEVLINKEVRTAVEDLVSEQVGLWLDSNPAYAKLVMARVMLAAQAREAAKRARDTKRNEKSMFETGILPGKYYACQTRDPEKAEIFIVEGKSAGGTATQGRDRFNQAILALKGKILNVEKVKYEKMITSAEICALITSLGAGIGRNFDIDKLRFHKVVIMTDADVDGYHIRTLLLTFFFRHMRELIERGYLYIAQPPLYKVKIGTRESYIKNDALLEEFLINHYFHDSKIFISGELVEKDKFVKLLPNISKAANYIESACPQDSELAECIFAYITLYHIESMHLFSDENFLNELSAVISKRFNNKYSIEFNPEERVLNVLYTVHRVNNNIAVNVAGFFGEQMSSYSSSFEGFKELMIQMFAFYDKDKMSFNAMLEIKNGKSSTSFTSIIEFANKFFIQIREGLVVQRFKGLGEMNAKQLWETALDPKERQFLQVTIEDAELTDKIFETLMGDDVELRRIFIEASKYLMDEIDT